MTSYGLGEKFEGDFADTCSGKKCPLVSMGGCAVGLACTNSGVWTPSVPAEILYFDQEYNHTG